MKPHVTCLMLSSIDGRLHPRRYTGSPDGTLKDWSAAYQQAHEALAGDAWLVGRVTMAEMAEAEAHPPSSFETPERPLHAAQKAASYAVALDRFGKLHFEGGDMDGDHVIVLLGPDVPDAHLAELAADGVSYVVADRPEPDLAALLEQLGDAFQIRRLLLEGGGVINGAFFAAGLVDALSVLVAPALDARENAESIVTCREGLAGKARLTLRSAETLDHGVVHLRYDVLAAS